MVNLNTGYSLFDGYGSLPGYNNYLLAQADTKKIKNTNNNNDTSNQEGRFVPGNQEEKFLKSITGSVGVNTYVDKSTGTSYEIGANAALLFSPQFFLTGGYSQFFPERPNSEKTRSDVLRENNGPTNKYDIGLGIGYMNEDWGLRGQIIRGRSASDDPYRFVNNIFDWPNGNKDTNRNWLLTPPNTQYDPLWAGQVEAGFRLGETSSLLLVDRFSQSADRQDMELLYGNSLNNGGILDNYSNLFGVGLFFGLLSIFAGIDKTSYLHPSKDIAYQASSMMLIGSVPFRAYNTIFKLAGFFNNQTATNDQDDYENNTMTYGGMVEFERRLPVDFANIDITGAYSFKRLSTSSTNPAVASDSYNVHSYNLGLRWNCTKDLSLFGSFNQSISKDTNNYYGKFGVDFRFDTNNKAPTGGADKKVRSFLGG